jgi:hypothetical protein
MTRFNLKNSLFILGALLLITPNRGHATDILAGIGSVDQGDDVRRPGAIFEVGINPSIFAGGFFFGRNFGPVKESAIVLNLGIKRRLFGNLPIKGRAGISLLDESTKISHSEFSRVEHNYNPGIILGAGYSRQFGRTLIQFVWDSHLYPAGINGAILLATGRKQIVALLIGVAL